MSDPPLTYRQVLRLPHVPPLLLSACLSRLAGQMFTLAIVLYALARFGSPTLAGWVAFASIAPGFAVSPIAGALLDRVGEAAAIVADLAVSALLLVALVVVSAYGAVTAPVLLVLVGCYSLTSPLSFAGIRALLPRLVPEPARDRANALDTGGYALTDVLGPVLAGPLFALAGAEVTMSVIAGFYLLAGVSLSSLVGRRPAALARSRAVAAGAPRPPLLREAAAGLGYLARHRTLRGLALAYSLYQVSWGVLVVAVPVLVVQELGTGKAADALTGVLWAVAGLAGGLGALVAGQLRTVRRERWFIALGALATAVAIFPVSTVMGLFGLGLGLALAGFLAGPVDVGVLTLRQRRTEPGRLGRVLAVSISLNVAGLPVGSAVGGLLVTQSLTVAFVVAAAASALSAAVTWLAVPGTDGAGGSSAR